MSLDTQVALARPTRGESSHLSRAARQVVPPFLQKLYEIVNDTANEELIRWSEGGDSFYVLNHEKFAREVLGRWFKHQKFASFVRQLNMYGFHKIPHLQQGVLKSDSDNEPWHFEHPNFHRGQPDLLCLIQRKKQPTHGAGDDAAILDVHDPGVASNGVANITPSQVMDINSIVSGISVIKRHQQAISADLSTLKQSNDALWKEAVAARQRHAKHQDTINRILKFLAGVFGHTDDATHAADGSHTPPQVTPRIRQRLMIGNSRSPGKGRPVDIMEVEDDEADLLRSKRSRTPFSDRHATIESVDTTTSSPTAAESFASSETFSSASDGFSDTIKTPAVRPSEVLSRTNSSNTTSRPPSVPPTNTLPSIPTNGAVPPAGLQNGQNPTDAMWQAAIQHMMQSPAQFQRIMQAFSGQQPYQNLPPDTHPNHTALSPYDISHDYTRWLSQSVAPNPSAAPVAQSLLAPIDDSSAQLLLDESNRLQKSYRDAHEISADMDMLQTSINSLIQDLGIDPGSLAQAPDDPSHVHGLQGSIGGGEYPSPLPPDAYANGMGVLNGISGLGVNDASQPDYLLDSLLSQISESSGADGGFGNVGVNGMGGLDGSSGLGGDTAMDYRDVTDNYDHSARIDGTSIEDASTEQLTAFLDEASSASSEATPSSVAGGSPLMGPAKAVMHAQKRKSDVVDVQLPGPQETGAGRKVKRKR